MTFSNILQNKWLLLSNFAASRTYLCFGVVIPHIFTLVSSQTESHKVISCKYEAIVVLSVFHEIGNDLEELTSSYSSARSGLALLPGFLSFLVGALYCKPVSEAVLCYVDDSTEQRVHH